MPPCYTFLFFLLDISGIYSPRIIGERTEDPDRPLNQSLI